MPSYIRSVYKDALKRVIPRMEGAWERVFRIQEIRESRALIWSMGAVMLSYFLIFSVNMYDPGATRHAFEQGSHVCWPYFQSCGPLMVLDALPHGYSQTALYMGMFALLLGAAYALSLRRFALAHACVSVVWAWHSFATFVLAYPIFANHDFYIFSFATILLFFRHREFFLKATIVLFYFLAFTVKVHPTWIAGEYFSSLQNGLPFVPNELIPYLTNLVLACHLFLPWLLFSSRRALRLGALAFFTLFHLYSGILVGYAFPTLILPIELILFGRFFRSEPIPMDARSAAGWIFVGVWCVAQSISFLIPGDAKLTMEGARFGQYMFESNHQCISTATIRYSDGSTSSATTSRHSHYDRCEPYRYWFRLNTMCERDAGIESVMWTFDHSINGRPFLRIVDVPDACALEYHPFRHNEWIKTEDDSPAVMGYPVKNFYD